MNDTEVTAVMVAYGPEPHLRTAVQAVLESQDVQVRLILVDNGCSNPDLADIASHPDVQLINTGKNTGFTGGCNLAAHNVRTGTLAFVNSDAIVAADALATLHRALTDQAIGLVCAKIVLREDSAVVNSAGNPVHFSLLSWAGHWGEHARDFTIRQSVASITGCVFALRSQDWHTLGGFHEQLFAYGEDVELSLRTWQSGKRVEIVPDAVAQHDYEFGRNPQKMFWLERNRWANLLTLYERRTLAAITPALAVMEVGLLATAAKAGWLPEKRRTYGWLWRHRRELRERRELVQHSRRVPDARVLAVLSDEIKPSPKTGMSVPPLVNRVLRWYGQRVRWILGAPAAADARVQSPSASAQSIKNTS